ncbi:hypothetical protein JXM67_01215 [candidate division WOR-3 bacterium]|nr:hypothetical protein [candidate division WOR-3 bacterium]
MKTKITAGVLLVAALVQIGISETEILEVSGIGFALSRGEADARIQAQPFMLSIIAHAEEEGEETDSTDVSSWIIDMAAMRFGFTTFFLDVLTLDAGSLAADIQPVSVNEYNQTILGDRIGELDLGMSLISGLPGGEGNLVLEGKSYEVIFYKKEVTNTFTRWTQMLK